MDGDTRYAVHMYDYIYTKHKQDWVNYVCVYIYIYIYIYRPMCMHVCMHVCK